MTTAFNFRGLLVQEFLSCSCQNLTLVTTAVAFESDTVSVDGRTDVVLLAELANEASPLELDFSPNKLLHIFKAGAGVADTK